MKSVIVPVLESRWKTKIDGKTILYTVYAVDSNTDNDLIVEVESLFLEEDHSAQLQTLQNPKFSKFILMQDEISEISTSLLDILNDNGEKLSTKNLQIISSLLSDISVYTSNILSPVEFTSKYDLAAKANKIYAGQRYLSALIKESFADFCRLRSEKN